MTRFTNSPYEEMMQEIPPGRERLEASPVWPPGHPCYGCPYGRDRPCMGICYRELMKGVRKNARKVSDC